MAEHLFIVSRLNPNLFTYLAREFSDEPGVTVIVDRREGQRRVGRERRAAPREDRRKGDRRARPETQTQISSLGYAFVRLS